jgi:hypothetical protein
MRTRVHDVTASASPAEPLTLTRGSTAGAARPRTRTGSDPPSRLRNLPVPLLITFYPASAGVSRTYRALPDDSASAPPASARLPNVARGRRHPRRKRGSASTNRYAAVIRVPDGAFVGGRNAAPELRRNIQRVNHLSIYLIREILISQGSGPRASPCHSRRSRDGYDLVARPRHKDVCLSIHTASFSRFPVRQRTFAEAATTPRTTQAPARGRSDAAVLRARVRRTITSIPVLTPCTRL